MTAELTDCVYALRKRIEDVEEAMEAIQARPARDIASVIPEVTDVRQAVRNAVIAVDDSWKEQYSTQFADNLLATLNRAGWRFIKTTEETL